MHNKIVIDIGKSELLYERYRKYFSYKKIPKLIDLQNHESVNDLLNKLAFFALKKDTTLPILYSFSEVFLDIVGRWITNQDEYERLYKEEHCLDGYQLNGSIVLEALSRIINVSEGLSSTAEYYLSRSDIFARMLSFLNERKKIDQVELSFFLLSFYRFITFNKDFEKYINTTVISRFIQPETVISPASRYVAHLILLSMSNSSENKIHEVLAKNFDLNNPILGLYDGDKTIDYRFLAPFEVKRLSNYYSFKKLNATNDSSSVEGDKLIEIDQSSLSPFAIPLSNILIPRLLDNTMTNCSSTKDLGIVPTNNSSTALHKLALGIQKGDPILVTGNTGSGKTFLISQIAKYMSYHNLIVKIHLGEQTDVKLLIGTYQSGEKPGSFEWRPGALTTAVKEGKWVLIEDIDKAPTEVLSVLLTLLEKKELIIPSRGEVVKARAGFQLLSTVRSSEKNRKELSSLIGLRLWRQVHIESPSEEEIEQILSSKFPLIRKLIKKFIACYQKVSVIYKSSSFIAYNKGSHPRLISVRDLIKLCSRCSQIMRNEGGQNGNEMLDASTEDYIFAEAVDCFGSAISDRRALKPVINAIGESLEIAQSRIELYIAKHVPSILDDDYKVRVGRSILWKNNLDVLAPSNKKSMKNFALTNHSLRLIEQLGVSIQMKEPVLLVGETGTGKTTVVQHLANMVGKKLTVINLSQQTESSDLLGGYKPINSKTAVVPIQEVFDDLFKATFSMKKNDRFYQALMKFLNKSQWKAVVKLWKEAAKMAFGILEKSDSDESNAEAPKKKRKLSKDQKVNLIEKWKDFQNTVKDFEIQAISLQNSFVFNFVEGSLVKAVRNGDWLLLDEINLASSETLECIADLLADSFEDRSILLSERGDTESVRAHSDFRIFGCMNPSTDIGKRELPSSIRSRFSEIYVHSPDRDYKDLISIVQKYIGRFAISDDQIYDDIAHLYLEAKKLAEDNVIVDGANQKPHFSIRTLTRVLVYVCDIVPIYGLRRSLFEGFCMAFLTLLDLKSEEVLKPLIVSHTIGKLKNMKAVISQIPPEPSKNQGEYVQFKHYWLRKGMEEPIPQSHYIITSSVEKNMLNLVRATASGRFPVLIQGPTSAGKTSMINFLAGITGHKFVRINNHEHTDLQEYVGSYVSDNTGKLVFKEGVLVRALREGHWIVLDELNLAPTDVLEALNRLLDDNRELFIPETQETVHPHPDFMLFATQNPPGIYGGRKFLSRAFRNRFLELHFDDIPEDELVVILEKRCKIAPSYCKKMVEVYKQLSVHRQSSRIFEQKNSFATLRDLFRWALRDAVGYEELAANGYMLLAEKVRKEAEKKLVKETIEKVMRVQLDMDAYYNKLENKDLTSTSSIVWTKAMKRLAVLVSSALAHREPVLLVGETGCGKTTICQILSAFLHKDLIMVNAHQNTETSDILGAQRPVRNRSELIATLCGDISDALRTVIENFDSNDLEIEDLIKIYRAQDNLDNVDPKLVERIEDGINKISVLFEWKDGPLVVAMKTGNLFLLDEISLADDSVLERLNSVLEPEKTLFLAEKGTEDSYIEARDGFDFLATMNPGGDYGKKELSPALRNRFTEIWVPSFDNIDDVKDIVFCSLNQDNKNLCDPLVLFVEWFGKKFGGDIGSGILSLRDILQWVKFLNSTSKKTDPLEAFLHGASMCFVDALGTNNTAHLAQNEQKLTSLKLECIDKLSSLVERDLREYYLARWEIKMTNKSLSCGPFEIPRDITSEQSSSFSLEAPTTAANAMRIIRALQVHKSILLEGSPGVGKTSLVAALAKACGINLHRINLSEQTDLVDIFGSDIPVEGGKPGEFAWRDAPFLRAMQKGEWVLLDEMNLASQSVLEGLNACLDHRGQAYIPELDKTFNSHPDFIIFAAQNPQYQGGGRKGLPKSFINRFCVVYVDILRPEDLELISGHLYPEVPVNTRNKLIDFMAKLEKEVITDKRFGSLGGPWEFNLRDALRWMELLKTNSFLDKSSAFDFFGTIISGRFRTEYDRKKALELFSSNFDIHKRDNIYNLSESFLQCNGAVLERDIQADKSRSFNLIPLQCNFPIIETMIHSVNINVPVILVGPPASGKTDLVRFTANVSGNELVEFSLNSEIDNMDLLGGYEQVDPARNISDLISKVKDISRSRIREGLQKLNNDYQFLQITSDFVNFLIRLSPDAEGFEKFLFSLKEYISLYPQEELEKLSEQADSLREKLTENLNLRFEWFDGLLVKAVETGSWLVLDNANLCSSSVLDRLNSLLETDGKLLMNECTSEDGQARVLEPHPKFRLFLTMDPKFGELSRAMRNRSVEIYVDPISDRATTFDRTSLDVHPIGNNEGVSADTKSRSAPVSSIIKCNDSLSRLLCIVIDIIENQELNYEAVSNIVYQYMPLYGTDNFEHFLHAINGSSEFKSEFILTLQNALKKIRYLKETNSLKKIEQLFTGPYEDADDLCQLPYLTLNPEVNMYASRSIRDRHIFSKETSFYFEVLNNILSIREHLLQVEERALAGKLTNLTFIESSAAENMGRELKKVSQVKIYDFIKSVHRFIEEFFMISIENSLVKDNVYYFLNKIQMLLYGLISCKDKNISARIRIFYQLLKAWFAEESHIFDEKHRKSFDDVLGSMSKYLDMASGVSMENIWTSFKGHYPRDLESWQRFENWVTLTKQFDEVVKEQFHDCFDSIIMLQNLIMSTFEKIKDGKVDEEEFEGLSKRLVEGISNLRDISSSFNCKRQNEFSFEFNLLANFVQGVDNEKPSEVQRILLLTDKSDFASLPDQSNNLFQPYPQLLDHLWFIDSQNSMSFVRGYFTNDLCINSIAKCQDAFAIPARNIPQTTDDIRYLATYLIRSSNSTLRDTRSEFTHLLFEWFSNILVANLAFFDEDGKNRINQIVTDSKMDNISISTLQEACQGCVQKNFRNIIINYFIPAIELVSSKDSFEQLGRAWVLFSFGCIQAYVPDAPYDPAIKEQLEKEMFNKLHNQMETIKNVWSKTREVISGDQPLLLEDYLTQDYSLDSLSESKVYREDSNIEPLFEEWKGFMEGIINNNLLSIIFRDSLDFGDQDLTALDIFHKSSERFLVRLSEKYNRYSDLNDILKGYTLGFRLGVELVTISSRNKNADVKMNNSWCLDVLELSKEKSVSSNFECIKDFIKKFDYSNSVPEQSMIFFINLCLCHKAYDTRSNLHTIFEEALQVIYYRWSLRHTKEKIEKEKKESIFRYKDEDEDESDFKKMFPDYEDFIDDETSSDSRKNDSFEYIYSQVADLYMSAFVSKEDVSIVDLVSQGSKLTKVLDRAKNTFMTGCNNDTVLHGLLQNLSESWHLLTGKKEEEPDFYRSPHPMEFKRASTLVNAIYNYTNQLIEQWPEHATLQIISRIGDEFLSFPIRTPVAKLLQKIEQLYTHIAEWEKYAHKGVSFSSFMNDITNLIVSWRRFELSTWKLLFKYEDDSLNANLGLWWFHLYEVLLQPLLAGVLEHETVPKVLDALNLFLNNCALGEYHTRIRLLKSFKEHIKMIDSEGKIYNALSNFIAYREIFIPVTKEKIESGKKALQKEIEEVILLASWKDVNIDALKQSSRRSHNNLYKIVRKYRDLIKSAVLPIVDGGLGHVLKDNLIPLEFKPLMARYLSDDTVLINCQKVSSWNERDAYLKDSSLLNKNLVSYGSRISKERIPNLKDYAFEVIELANSLNHETPKVLTTENKKVISALKTQKRKLLSDTLKELKRIGLKSHIGSTILNNQGSVNNILSTSNTFEGSYFEGCDAYYYGTLDILPKLRSAVASCSNDVPQADMMRGHGFLENLVLHLGEARNPLVKFSNNIMKVSDWYMSFKLILEENMEGKTLIGFDFLPQKESVGGLSRKIFLFTKLIDYTISTIEACSPFMSEIKLEIFFRAKSQLSKFDNHINSTKTDICSSLDENTLEEFKEFLQSFSQELEDWKNRNVNLAFMSESLLSWAKGNSVTLGTVSESDFSSEQDMNDVENAFRKLSMSILISFQKIVEVNSNTLDDEQDNWFEDSKARLVKYMKNLRVEHVSERIFQCVDLVNKTRSKDSCLVYALVSFTLPQLYHYIEVARNILTKCRENYEDTAIATSRFANILSELCQNGFCSPEKESEEKNNDALQDGTGLGDGEGVQNESKDDDIDEDDLNEEAQTENKDQDKGDKDEEDDEDAKDIEGDMAGDLEDLSDQDEQSDAEEENELDEEVDDLNDDDPNAIDEKMWNEEAKDDEKEKESDKPLDKSNQDGDMEGNDQDDQEIPEDKEKKEGEENEGADEPEEENEDGDDNEGEDVGEQEDEVKNDEMDQLEENVPEADALDIPEDMNLDDDEENDHSNNSENNESDSEMDIDDNSDVDENQEPHEQEDQEVSDDDQKNIEEEDPSQEMDEGEENAKENDEEHDNSADTEEHDEEPRNESDEESNINNNDSEEIKNEAEAAMNEEGIDISNNQNTEEVDKDTATNQTAGESGEGADKEVSEEQDDVGASGDVKADTDDKSDRNEENNVENSRDAARESLKQLGDSLKEYHNRKQDINEASNETEEPEKSGENAEEFQHLEGEETNNDTQALGSANQDQVQKINEDNMIEDQEEGGEEATNANADEVLAETMNEDKMNVENDITEHAEDNKDEALSSSALMKSGSTDIDEDNMIVKEEPEDFDDQMDNERKYDMVQDLDTHSSPRDFEEARELWRMSDQATQELASGLCEQLRLILEPTKSTKLKGDYKTGKRLNMKRIIPYIASDFRKDKIWLRRTKPSKREYQVMLAIDDSKSMYESGSVELAFNAVALVCKALNQLESGDLSVVRFGEDVKVVHSFDKPFNGHDSGPKIFQWFDFQQTRTDVRQLCESSLNIFEEHRVNNDLWQLQIIISDGVCEDHDTLKKLVRKAREERIMLVFVIIDTLNSEESIIDMSQVKYNLDPDTNSMNLEVKKYLETFPFDFYVVVRNINELPEMLSLILRQYFSEVAST
ncbi:Piso0_005679 [Millerozyma farinosa CBS 7064]|uniref:Midasin n=1 Tax=Pichia sorbitophila (strain ATCC MYA-4447 / BCRC 22081 / CBS 7064 / NBRC 10061 / NRRL Y-12695) TaxID=559304 RepID=G8Y2M4_PICSO|nr:Piso0_005679 [Millerozyma farinosa CBS 7064]